MEARSFKEDNQRASFKNVSLETTHAADMVGKNLKRFPGRNCSVP